MLTKLIVILGPTASGKSDIAVSLAKKFNGEVISADSRQVYKGLDIGTGKITKKEMGGVEHYLLDVASPKKVFTAAEYKKLGTQAIEKISKKNKLPIICGGTGFYIDALLGDKQIPNVPPDLKLRNKLEKKSVIELFEILKKLDPERAKNIDAKNPRRLIRAIEICQALGKVPKFQISNAKYKTLKIGIRPQAEILKARISKRLIARIKKGMIKEAEKLHRKGLSWQRMIDLGLEYRYQALLLQKKISKSEFLKELNMAIQHYAKRQITWFKRDKKTNWFEPKEINKIEKCVKNFLTLT